jgi:Fe-S-cluster containining protein
MVPAWLDAARDHRIRAKLEAVHTLIADQVAARSPACWASGRCCNFKATGHLLYVTGLEAAYLMSHLGRDLKASEVTRAIERGDCPFLHGTLCGVHAVKPTGCRLYFCDASARDWQEELSERTVAMIRELHVAERLEYRYGEWRRMLAAFASRD